MKTHQIFHLIVFGCLSAAVVNADENTTNENGPYEIPTIVIETNKVKQVSVNEVKSADLAEVLNKKQAGVSLVRRSGIANDIILRGQKKDNINILIDNAKIYGACPNRMDPPTSHILTNNIDDIEIIDGPYDVENFGTLSGAVKITTRMPEQGFNGKVSLNVGSWDYQKFAATLSGGGERVRGMLSVSQETGGQYEDGDGNDFSEQIDTFMPGSMANYKPEFDDIDAYEKKTFMGKLFASITDNQELVFSYTANRSDDVLYLSSPMDALYDDSDIINLGYTFMNLGGYSKALEVQIYDSKVEHPMSNFYRLSSGPNSANERISFLETHTQGAKIINEMDISRSTELKFGVDASTRNWDGEYQGFGTSAGITGIASIPDVDTENRALFVELNQDYSKTHVKFGARIDDTSITPEDSSLASNDYSGFSAFVFATYQLSDNHKLFGGFGRSTRVPDARELYFHSAGGGGMLIGNPELEDTINTEIDLGIETIQGDFFLKAKLFYSKLDDFIHYNDSKMLNRFDNVDATIYGLDVSGSYDINSDIYLDFGLAYQRGSKDEALPGQTDKDLAEIPPMKGNIALNYQYRKNTSAMIEVIAADSWNSFDEDNGEQALDSWAVMNLKVKHEFNQQFGITVSIDNLFDDTYAVSNTYKDLILLADGTGEVILMNEPGRYFYLNGVYSF